MLSLTDMTDAELEALRENLQAQREAVLGELRGVAAELDRRAANAHAAKLVEALSPEQREAVREHLAKAQTISVESVAQPASVGS